MNLSNEIIENNFHRNTYNTVLNQLSYLTNEYYYNLEQHIQHQTLHANDNTNDNDYSISKYILLKTKQKKSMINSYTVINENTLDPKMVKLVMQQTNRTYEEAILVTEINNNDIVNAIIDII